MPKIPCTLQIPRTPNTHTKSSPCFLLIFLWPKMYFYILNQVKLSYFSNSNYYSYPYPKSAGLHYAYDMSVSCLDWHPLQPFLCSLPDCEIFEGQNYIFFLPWLTLAMLDPVTRLHSNYEWKETLEILQPSSGAKLCAMWPSISPQTELQIPFLKALRKMAMSHYTEMGASLVYRNGAKWPLHGWPWVPSTELPPNGHYRANTKWSLRVSTEWPL